MWGFLGIAVLRKGLRWGARSFPCLWLSMRAFAGGFGGYGVSQDSGQVLPLFTTGGNAKQHKALTFSLTLAAFPGQRKVLPTSLLLCWLPQQRASHAYLQPTSWHIARINKAREFSY